MVLVQSSADNHIWSPVLEGLDMGHTLSGAAGVNKAKRYAIEEARRYNHIEAETIEADLRWRRGESTAGKSALVLEVRVRG